MVQLDPNIILSGRQVDIPGSFQRGLEFKNQRRGFKASQDLANLFQEHGPGIASGDEFALGLLAQQSPFLSQQAQTGAAQNAANTLGVEQQRELLEAKRGLALARAGDTPERWDALARSSGHPEFDGRFNDREQIIAMLESTIGALESGDQNQLAIVRRAIAGGLVPGTPEFEEFVRRNGRGPGFSVRLADGTVIQQGEQGGRFDFGAPQGVPQPGAQPVPEGTPPPPDVDTERALGLPGAVRTWVNVLGDYLGFGQLFKETGRATDQLTFLKTRFLFATRNMVNQRMTNQMLDLVDRLTVAPGAVGKDGAMLRLKSGLRLVEDNVSVLQRVVDNFDGKSSDKAVSDAKADGILLQQLAEEYKGVIASLEGLEEAAPEVLDLRAGAEQPFFDEELELRLRAYD